MGARKFRRRITRNRKRFAGSKLRMRLRRGRRNSRNMRY